MTHQDNNIFLNPAAVSKRLHAGHCMYSLSVSEAILFSYKYTMTGIEQFSDIA